RPYLGLLFHFNQLSPKEHLTRGQNDAKNTYKPKEGIKCIHSTFWVLCLLRNTSLTKYTVNINNLTK
ncbi:MAG: hypothetical protein ACK53Y_14390, partial [bacterium]